MLELNCVLSPYAKLPELSEDDVGINLYAYLVADNKPQKLTILPNDIVTIDTGVTIKLSQGFVGMLFNPVNLSSIGIESTQGIGLVTSNYRDNIKITFHNRSDKAHIIYWGDLIARLIIQPVSFPKIVQAKFK
jgi:dUTPase